MARSNMLLIILGLLAVACAGSFSENKDSYKNQFHNSGHAGKHKGKHGNFSSEYCTDPRTMKKHAAYTEWADAYSCTRHRCQPGGRNLAIYTVGCKRVEAPESAIECEEVVEDTNMQFPFCCTRLRCLVVVRGEVWTRVLGQPWEVLPAAPWSHMYKMKKPPPADSSFLPKTTDQGPVYELSDNESDQGGHDKVLRSDKKPDNTDYNEIPPEPVPRAAMPTPDIVIALSTNEGKDSSHNKISRLQSKRRKANSQPPAKYFEEETKKEKQTETENEEVEEVPNTTEQPQEAMDEENEKFIDVNNNNNAATQKLSHKSHNTHSPVSWTEMPQSREWNEPKETADVESRASEHNNNHQPPEPQFHDPPKKYPEEKPSNLQALVDAIGTRMRDIENVVQKMSVKVHQAKPESSREKRMSAERDGTHKRHKEPKRPSGEVESYKRVSAERDGTHKRHKELKRPSGEDEGYKRFNVLNERGSKYLHSSADSTTEKPLFIEDTNLNGYFSDASNSVLRRKNLPKEPAQTYMAPVIENRRKAGPVHIAVPDNGEDAEKKHKKHSHKKRRSKHKKHSHSKDDKRKHFNRLSSGEAEKNAVSLDDSDDLAR